MLVRYSELKKPTDKRYAFRLRPSEAFRAPVPGHASDIREVVQAALVDGDAERFEARIARWSGPEDVDATGAKPYESAQNTFIERPWPNVLTMGDVDGVLRGNALVLRDGARIDFVLRDHHMLDVVLYAWATSGLLPTALFHADRHSDWCRDSFLDARRPDQAATWWRLLEGLKRPGADTPVLREEDVLFTTAKAAPRRNTGTRDIGAELLKPWFLSNADTEWPNVLARPEIERCDWVSLDLDLFQPSTQLAITKGLLRDDRFRAINARAAVRVFVLSPQFTAGGDKIARWTIHGRLHSTLRLLNHLRYR